MIKLKVEDEVDVDYLLLGINTVLDDYKLVFLINKLVPFQLAKSIIPPFLNNKNNISFEFFKYENEEEEIFWYLIPNQIKLDIDNQNSTFSLFEDTIIKKEYFIPESKKMDYILKITDNNLDVKQFIKNLKQIYNISSAIIIDIENIKYKNHLTF